MLDRDARNAELQRYFHFTAEDLRVNRQGRMTESQLKRMNETMKTNKMLGNYLALFLCLIGLVLMPILLCAGTVQLYQALSTSGASLRAALADHTIFVVPGLMLAILGLFGGAIFVVTFLTRRAKHGFMFTVITGPLYYKKTSGSSSHGVSSISYYLKIGKQEFEVSSGLGELIGNGEKYSVYYADYQDGIGGGELISLELLE